MPAPTATAANPQPSTATIIVGATLAALTIPLVAGFAAPAEAANIPNDRGTQTVRVTETARQERVEGIQYRADVSQKFKVKFGKNGVKYVGDYSGRLDANAIPTKKNAKSQLTLLRTRKGEPVVTTGEKKIAVKGKKGKVVFRTVTTVTVKNEFTGWVKTKSDNVYRQSGTLSTTVFETGRVSNKINLGEEVKVSNN